MKKKLVFFMLLVFIFILNLVSVGCTSKDSHRMETPVSVSLVLGAHANSKSLNLRLPIIKDTITSAIKTSALISVISAEGTPRLIDMIHWEIPEQYKNADKHKKNSDAEKQVHALLSDLSEIKAISPELDTLESLRQAVRAFASAPENSQHFIIILDTGLSTSGLLDFRNNLIDADPKIIAQSLFEKKAIPDFSGITIIWRQLGDVASPQQSLTEEQRSNLKHIWKAIIEKTGGIADIEDDIISPYDNDSADYPKISLVQLPLELSLRFDPTKATVFGEDQIFFIPDTSQYINPEAAQSILVPVAEYMRANPDFRGLLIGSTASAKDKNYCFQLSLDRANAVRDTLLSLGVAKNQLVTIGLGYSDPWHIPDKNPDGSYIESLASKNRKVVLLSFDSPEAYHILNKNK